MFFIPQDLTKIFTVPKVNDTALMRLYNVAVLMGSAEHAAHRMILKMRLYEAKDVK
jgi:hypothetical protein